MPNYPQEVPAPWDASDASIDAYRAGWNRAHGAACHNVPRLGSEVFTEDLGRVRVTADNVRDVHASLTRAAVGFSDFPEGAEPETVALFDACEAGEDDSILADLETYTDADYGVEIAEAA